MITGYNWFFEGYDGTTSLRTVECYFPESNRWAMMAPMIKHRSAAGVVALGHYVYAIGGHDGMSIFDSVSYGNVFFKFNNT